MRHNQAHTFVNNIHMLLEHIIKTICLEREVYKVPYVSDASCIAELHQKTLFCAEANPGRYSFIT